ncbi:MAG: TlyA family RNA methyltransferase [Actinomycetota bacterium]|nr:TlyA family RNA methyltransferase [Actinomycetota bacterium]
MRLDRALVAKLLFDTESDAHQAIDDRRVSVNGSIAISHGFMVAPSDELLVIVPPKYVSRGGFKLEAAIAEFDLVLKDMRVLDVGASTGGFTDCALQHGAREVVALDIGKNLLHEKIAGDARVVVVENTNAREINRFIKDNKPNFDKLFDIAVVDLSFISVHEVLGSVLSALKNEGTVIVLVKPQFEASKNEADKASGVITDSAIHGRVCQEVAAMATGLGCDVQGIIESPIRGHDGNHEFLLVAKCTRLSL